MPRPEKGWDSSCDPVTGNPQGGRGVEIAEERLFVDGEWAQRTEAVP